MATRHKLVIAVVVVGSLAFAGWQAMAPADEPGMSTAELDDGLVSNEPETLPELAPQPLTAPDEEPTQAEDDPATPEAQKKFGEGPSTEALRQLGLFEQAPPGVLEGAFFVGEDASSDAEAFVWDARGAGTAAGIPSGREPLDRVLVGSDGRFRFDHLAPGSYFVGIQVPGQSARLAYRTLKLGADPTDKAIIVFGTGEVTGHVFDASGTPAVDVTVRISNQGVGAWETIADTRTDAQGYYAFVGLLEGGGWLTVALTNDFDDRQQTRSRQTFLKRGDLKVEDFGSPSGTPRLTGTARARNGAPLRGPGRIILSERDSKQHLDVAYDASGQFEHRAPPGVYDVHVWLQGMYGHRIMTLEGALTVGEVDLTQDFEVPGARMHGTVTAAERSGARGRIGCVRDRVWIWVAIAGDGTYEIDGLEPGTYQVRADGITEQVTIVEGQTEARLDLAFPPR